MSMDRKSGNCQAQVQSKIQVQNPSPKSKIQSPEEKEWTGTRADNIIQISPKMSIQLWEKTIHHLP